MGGDGVMVVIIVRLVRRQFFRLNRDGLVEYVVFMLLFGIIRGQSNILRGVDIDWILVGIVGIGLVDLLGFSRFILGFNDLFFMFGLSFRRFFSVGKNRLFWEGDQVKDVIQVRVIDFRSFIFVFIL